MPLVDFAHRRPETVSGHGHAKVILCGEHWVLDGAEALAIGLPQLGAAATMQRAGTPSLQLDPALADHAAADAAQMVALALRQADVDAAVAVTLGADVPVRRGLGSSAAVAVALVRAAAALGGQALTTTELRARARALEALVHGRSSGLDPAAATCDRGGVLFRDGAVVRDVGPVHAELAAARWLLVDLGAGEPTRTAVSHALGRREAMAPATRRRWLDEVSATSHAAAAALEGGRLHDLAAALTRAGAALEPLDVATAAMRWSVQALCSAGALAAKPTGAGLGGVVLALCGDDATAGRAAAATAPVAVAHWILPVYAPA
jgi:mevalonate kinase